MFAARMEQEILEKPVKVADSTGFSVTKYLTQEPISIYLLEKPETAYRTNELDLRQSECVGYTLDSRPAQGWRIAGKWLVQSVTKHRTGYALSLVSFGDSQGSDSVETLTYKETSNESGGITVEIW